MDQPWFEQPAGGMPFSSNHDPIPHPSSSSSSPPGGHAGPIATQGSTFSARHFLPSTNNPIFDAGFHSLVDSGGRYMTDRVLMMMMMFFVKTLKFVCFLSQVTRYTGYIDTLRTFFRVDTSYVLRKLLAIIFPFSKWPRRSSSSLRGNVAEGQGGFSDPHFATVKETNVSKVISREVHGSPDLYIPTLAFVSYTLLCIALRTIWNDDDDSRFDNDSSSTLKDVFTSNSAWGVFVVVVEALLYKIGFLLLSSTTENLTFLSLIAYSGYKYVGIVFVVLISIISGGSQICYWISVVYLSLACSVFLQRSLAPSVLANAQGRLNQSSPKMIARKYFLFCASLIQVPFFLFLTFGLRNGAGKWWVNVLVLFASKKTTPQPFSDTTTTPTTPTPPIVENNNPPIIETNEVMNEMRRDPEV